MPDALVATLAISMARLITAIDLTDDDEVDPELATGWFEEVAHAFDELSPADRRRLAELFVKAAEQEARPAVRASMMELPDSFGLVDDDDVPPGPARSTWASSP